MRPVSTKSAAIEIFLLLASLGQHSLGGRTRVIYVAKHWDDLSLGAIQSR